MRLDRKRRQSVTVLLKALGGPSPRSWLEFGQYDSIRATLEKGPVKDRDEALLDIYRKLRPANPRRLKLPRLCWTTCTSPRVATTWRRLAVTS